MSRLAAITVAFVLAGAASAYADPGEWHGERNRQFQNGEGGRPGRAPDGGDRDDRPDFRGGEQHGMPARPAPSAAPTPPPAPAAPSPAFARNDGGQNNGGQNNGGQNNGRGGGGRDWSQRDGGNPDGGNRGGGDWRGRGGDRSGAPQGSPGQFAYRNNGGAPRTDGPGNGYAPRAGDGQNDYALRGGPGRGGGDNDRIHNEARGGPDRGGDRWTERGRDTGRDNGFRGGPNGGRDYNYAADTHRDRRFDNGRPGEGHDFRDRDRGRAWYSPQIYNQYYHAQYRYRIAPYRYPYGWFERSWYYGEYLPNAWYTPTYYLDWRAYGLGYPPIGCEWVRVGNNALLVDIYTGEILSIYYDLFW